MDLPGILLQHEVTVEPYAGTSGRGTVIYGAAFAVECFVDEKRRLVRNPQTGEEETSATTFYCQLDTAGITVKSRVTLPSGRVATVLDVARRDGGGLPVPSHLEVILT